MTAPAYTAEDANRDRRLLTALLRPVVDAICAAHGVTRAEILAGALATGGRPSQHPSGASEEVPLGKRRAA